MLTTLVIAVGNTARGDDGVGHAVARLLEHATSLADARIEAAVDLDVAMAADVAECDLLIIIDAERRPRPACEVRRISPGRASRPTGHSIDAAALLGITQALYGHAPDAYVVSVAAPEMGHTESLSEIAEAASIEAASAVQRLVSETQPTN